MPTLSARRPPVPEDHVSPGHVAGLADVLEAVEAELASLGWSCPEAEFTEHDRAFLAAVGAL